MAWPFRRNRNPQQGNCPKCRGLGTVTRIYSIAGPTRTIPGGTIGSIRLGTAVEQCAACLPHPAAAPPTDTSTLPQVGAK